MTVDDFIRDILRTPIMLVLFLIFGLIYPSLWWLVLYAALWTLKIIIVGIFKGVWLIQEIIQARKDQIQVIRHNVWLTEDAKSFANIQQARLSVWGHQPGFK
jgi:hypothetical protein